MSNSETRGNHSRSFMPTRSARQLAGEILGIEKPNPLELPATNNVMEFQRAARRRKKLQNETVVRIGKEKL